MKFRELFIRHAWWGKIAGAILGYLIGGSTGALIGILLGNIIDHRLVKYFSRPHWSYHIEKRKAVQKVFFETTFSIMGYIAKCDGRISEEEIQIAEILMQEMQLNRQQKFAARENYNEGKKRNFDLEQKLAFLHYTLHDNPELIQLFIDIQYRAAKVDGLSLQKQQALNTVLQYLGFAPLNRQYRFFEDFVYSYNYHQNNQQSSSSQQYQRPPNILDHSFGILGIPPTSNKSEVKRAYRKLMSRNHPDKLIAQGLPEEMIKLANEKTQKIRKAYEEICMSKGW